LIDKTSKTLLLVEDDLAVASVQKKLLESLGYIVSCFPDGESAVNDIRAAKNCVDLILMDIDLGEGIDGTETAQRILKTHDIPIIFLSSHIEKEIVEKTEKITSYGYVVKNSGLTVLDASIKMAFKLFEANIRLKNHEKKLIESERRFDMLAEQNRTVAWEVDTAGMYTYVSTSSMEVIGYQPEELVGQKYYYELCPEYERKNLVEAASKVFEKRDRFVGLENPVLAKDGSIVWVSTNGFPVFNDDGSFRGYCGADTDITALCP
jgi:PAS domain S-box-containing protein